MAGALYEDITLGHEAFRCWVLLILRDEQAGEEAGDDWGSPNGLGRREGHVTRKEKKMWCIVARRGGCMMEMFVKECLKDGNATLPAVHQRRSHPWPYGVLI